MLESLYQYFGKKDRVAHVIWGRFGAVDNYVEPFLGSCAVLLARPGWQPAYRWQECVNDLDAHLANFWRSVKNRPAEVAKHADYPIIENDMHARHLWLVNRAKALSEDLGDADYCDPKAAGFWVWGIAAHIGSGWCAGNGPWVLDEKKRIVNKKDRPHLHNSLGVTKSIPRVSGGQGIHRNLDSLGGVAGYLAALSARLRHVRGTCGDWTRVLEPSVTTNNGMTAVLLDPPYTAESGRTCTVYREDNQSLGHKVAKWCRDNQNEKLLKICLCGYKGEYDMPGWVQHTWKTASGFSNMAKSKTRAKENSKREVLWFSPSCTSGQGNLFR